MANENMNSPKDAAMAILAKAQKLLDNKSSATIEDIQDQDMKKSAEYTSGLHTVAYYGLDKYNPQQAALAVLAKSQDLLSETVSARTDGLQKSAEAESGMHKVEYYSQPFEKAETGHEKGINTQSDPSQRSRVMMGTSKAGSQLPSKHKADHEEAKGVHKQVLGEMKNMGKPSLPKSENLEKKYEGFKAVEESARESGASDPGAVAAAAGRKKYGKHAFQEAAAHGHKMGKGENPDEKQDAKLGEEVEHLCEDHMVRNASAERKEGHKLVSKAECVKCVSGMQKSEWSDLYADLEVMAKAEKEDENEIGTKFVKDEGQGSGIKKQPSNDMKPKIEEKPIERDYKDFETQPGKPSASPDHREEPSNPTPAANPAAHGQGSNPPAGATPGTGKKGVHKLSFFMGHRHSKKSMKKGIALG